MSAIEKVLSKKLQTSFGEKQSVIQKQPAVFAQNFIVPNQINFNYVMIGSNTIPVYNDRVPARAGVKIWVGYDAIDQSKNRKSRFQVLGTRSEDAASGQSASLSGSPHAKSHEWMAEGGGNDMLHVHQRAISFLRVSASNTARNVKLYRGKIWTGSTFKNIPTQNIDLSAQIPSTSGKAAEVLITINTSGIVVQTKGSEVDIDSLSEADRPAIPADTASNGVCCFVRVYYGQVKPQEGRANTDFDDVRFSNYSVGWQLVANDTKEPTGWVDPDAVSAALTYDSGTQKITLTGTHEYYWRGIKHTVTNYVSTAHENTTGHVYFLSSSDGDTFTWGQDTPWAFDVVMLAVVNYQIGYKFAIAEGHGLMQHETHEELHCQIGTYKQSGGTLDPASYTLNSTTATNRRPDVVAAYIHDEDIEHGLDALASETYNKFTLSGTGGNANFSGLTADIVPLSTNNPYWNEFTGGSWQQTLMSNNSYMSVWLVGVPTTHDANSESFRYLWVQGQSNTSTLAGQQALSPLDVSLGTLSAQSPEYIFLVKIIIQYTAANWKIIEVGNLSGSKLLQTSSQAGNYLSGVSTDGSLTGNGTTGNLLSTASGETTEAAAGTTTITVNSASQQELTGSTTHTHTLPIVSTLRLGQAYKFINNSTGAWTIKSSGSDEVAIIGSGDTVFISCISITGTDETSWSVFRGGSGGISDAPSDGATYGRKNAAWEAITSGGAPDYILVRDEKSQNTAGGAVTASAWRKRDVNTEVSDVGGHCSIASSQITLAAGTYTAYITCPARDTTHQARLYNVTGSAVLLLGTSNYLGSGHGGNSIIAGRFTLSVQSVLEIQDYATSTTTYGNGYGQPANISTEIYTVAEFWKVG